MGRLMRAEPEEMTVRRLSQRPRGGSGNNPFLKANRSVMEYNVLIEPQQIAKKIMQVTSVLNVEVARAGSKGKHAESVETPRIGLWSVTKYLVPFIRYY